MAGNLSVCVLFYGHSDEDPEFFMASSGIYCSDSDRAGSDRTSRQKENTLWKDRPSVDRLSGGKIWIWTGDRSSRTVYIFNHVSLFCADPAGVDPSSYGTSGPDLPGKTKRRLICCFDKDSQCGRRMQ